VSPRGFTLTEALIALSILGVALAGVLPTFLTYSDTNTMNEERSGAVAAAQLVAEGLRQVDPAGLPTTGTSPVQVVRVGDRDYEVTQRYCVRSEFCGADSRHLTIEVRYGGRTVYSVETVYTRLR
jgi:prepilin-type N-terminal cleavage/methylation domain-containing protein